MSEKSKIVESKVMRFGVRHIEADYGSYDPREGIKVTQPWGRGSRW
jgi:hypothetical protein